MADDYTSSLLLTQPEVNANQNVWGPKLNSGFGSQLLDEAIVGGASYTLSGPKTLTRTNGASDEARKRIQHITGGTGGTVTIPAVPIWYWFINRASGNVTVTNGSNSVVVPAGSATGVFSPDGTALIVGLTKAYVDALAFNAALPNQTGQDKKFVTTDGTNAFFDFVSLTESVKGVLPLSNGGTGQTTLPALKQSLAGWTQVGTPVPLTGSSAVTLTDFPATYSDLYIVIAGLDQTAAGNVLLSLSDNGTNFTGTVLIYPNTPGSGAGFGGIVINGIRYGTGNGHFSVTKSANSRDISSVGGTFFWRCPSVTHVRLSLSTGTFGGVGTATVYAR